MCWRGATAFAGTVAARSRRVWSGLAPLGRDCSLRSERLPAAAHVCLHPPEGRGPEWGPDPEGFGGCCFLSGAWATEALGEALAARPGAWLLGLGAAGSPLSMARL